MTAALRFEPVAFEAGKTTWSTTSRRSCRYGATAGGQALAALLDNAVKYSAGGTDIRLTAEKQGRFAVVAVADSGPGHPADKLPHIFDRFYRADEAGRTATALDWGCLSPRPSSTHTGARCAARAAEA